MKQKLIELAKEYGFESKILYGKPYKHSANENLRYQLWLEEFSNKIFQNEKVFIEISSIVSFPYFRFNVIKFTENSSISMILPEEFTSQLFKTRVEALEFGIIRYFNKNLKLIDYV